MSILPKNIRYLRKKNEWSQEYVAEKLGYKSYTTIQKWEMGTSEPPLKKTRELADLFNVDIDDLTNKNLEFTTDLMEGNSGQETYYLNDETAKVAQEIFEEHKVLFDVYRSSDKDRLVEYAKRLKALRDMEEGNT